MLTIRGSVISVFLLGCVLMVNGCSEPRIDATDDETLGASLERVTAGMTVEQRKDFLTDATTISMKKLMQYAMRQLVDGKPPSMTDVFKDVHGMTATEIRAQANEVRDQLRRQMRQRP